MVKSTKLDDMLAFTASHFRWLPSIKRYHYLEVNIVVPTCSLTSCTDMDDIETASNIREKYTHFRILVIGRANAGKTTLLQRVCNTTEEPCIYDEENNNLVRFPFALWGRRPLTVYWYKAGANLRGDLSCFRPTEIDSLTLFSISVAFMMSIARLPSPVTHSSFSMILRDLKQEMRVSWRRSKPLLQSAQKPLK